MTEPLPDAAAIMAAVRATWPPSALHRVGPFDLPAEQEGTRRATSARQRPGATVTPDDIAAVETARPGTVFGTIDGTEDATADLLAARGYKSGGISDLMAGPVTPICGETPRVSGFAHWPPLAVCGTLWDAHGNPAPRRAPADRAPDPKTTILLRHSDRAAGALFVGIHARLAVLHLVLTLPRFRRQGVGRLALRHAANWAAERGADHIVLPVEADNAAAVGLYEGAGLVRRGGYRYWTQT
ncbi:GNAT family N-acetyltransferase [Jannaschia marina]|uniref:GNAT family N-acetyltransferase n=1 Tax=Jannaschia marina TaxID=2741674 RepID=UPI0015CED3F2|nr:GNAT family N-acetyltransferase [Jannaschia marina]